MLLSLIVLFLIAFLAGYIMEKCKLPALIGYLLTGLFFSPYTAIHFENLPQWINNLFLSHQTISLSTPFRDAALYIILLRAGLGLDRTGLKLNGKSTLLMSVVPCLLEAATVTIAAHFIFGLPFIESSILAFVIAAVSPAVIVPQMLKLQKDEIGTDKKIPTMILAGSTVDDILAISGFGICLSMLALETNESWQALVFKIPFSILTGAALGYYLARPIAAALKRSGIHASFCALFLICIAFGFKQLEQSNIIFFSHLIAILSFGLTLQTADFEYAEVLSKWMSKFWSIAVVILFVLIGAMVNPGTAINAGGFGLLILLLGLLARSAGVYFSLKSSQLNQREKLFCIIAYLPKATVQAAIGGTVMAMFYNGKIWLYNGAATGDLIIAMAALSILITAPLGAIGIRFFSKKLLNS